LKLTIFFAIF
jgi:hypothetical protein